MTRQTTLHKYTVPTDGDTNYATTFDSYFDDIDNDIEVRDIEANVGDYTPKNGAKFYATDTGAVYNGDGSSWNKISTSGSNPTFQSVSTDQASIAGNTALRQTDFQSANLSIGTTWVQPNANRPVVVTVEAFAETDGTTSGNVDIEIDYSGGTTKDVDLRVVNAPTGLGSSGGNVDSISVPIKAGAQIRVVNINDPNANNTITASRYAVL